MASSHQKERKTLEFFIEKADKLERLGFTKYLLEQGKVGFSIHFGGEFVTVQRQGPGEDATDAFLLTLRFFVQDNENISIRRIGELYEALPVDEELKKVVRGGRDTLNRHLDRPSMVRIGAESPTRRRIFDIFLYGGHAHGTAEKRAVYETWRQRPEMFAALEAQFQATLVDLLEFIFWLRERNKAAVAQLP